MLNKSKLLAGAVAVGAVVCSHGVFAADGKGAVYGDIRWSLNHADAKRAPASYSATNNNSYWGIKGSVTEGELTAFGAYENTLNNDSGAADTTRQGYFGLKSGTFGTLQYGQFATAYMESGRKLDPFANTAVAGVTGVGAFNSHGLSGLTAETFRAGFVNNQVAYTTPSFGGLTVNAAFFLDESTSGAPPVQDKDHDYGGGAEFNHSGITVGVQALDINSGAANFSVPVGGVEVVRAYGGLNTGRFGANVSVEKASIPGPDADYVFASAWFGVTPATRIAAAAGFENESGAEGTSVSLGVFHNVMKNFTGWVAARRFDGSGNPSTGGSSGVVNDVITMGASYKFNLGFGS